MIKLLYSLPLGPFVSLALCEPVHGGAELQCSFHEFNMAALAPWYLFRKSAGIMQA